MPILVGMGIFLSEIATGAMHLFANAKRTQRNDTTTIVYDPPHDVKVMTLDLYDYCSSISCR